MTKHLKNMSLKERAESIWGDPIDGVYAQEASTLSANSDYLPRNMCPKCIKLFSAKNNLVRTECSPSNEKEMGETLAWHFRHACGAKIVIFND